MEVLYKAHATASGGGREDGRSATDDGKIDVKLSTPTEMGGKGGDGTNPEQLFAAGYAACFGNAVIHITRNRERKIGDDAVEVTATVGMEPNAGGAFALTVALDVTIAGVDQEMAEAIVEEAHKVCPYSNATRGNIEVALSVKTR